MSGVLIMEKARALCIPGNRGSIGTQTLTLHGVPIPVNKEHKFLDVLDHKLNFISHIKELKCLKTTNILVVLSHQSYGADNGLQLCLYTALVGSHLDYGSVVYGSATKTSLRMLDPVLHLGLRHASGAFPTSPVQSLYAECSKWCLDRVCTGNKGQNSRVFKDFQGPENNNKRTSQDCKNIFTAGYLGTYLLHNTSVGVHDL